MKKNNFLYILCCGILGLSLMMSCNNDIVFPDPGFELSDKRVSVRRDTADYYDIKFKMNVPNKVAKIEILEARNYEVMDEVTEYNGKTNFSFNYRVDLTPYEKDTSLVYIIKVTDKDERSVNTGMRIDVKPFSFPTIALVGGQNIAVAAPAYYLKGIVNTGLNTIANIKLVFNGEQQYEFNADPNDPKSEMTLNELVFFGNLELGQVYDLDVVIEDDKGQVSTTTVTVRKTDFIKKPKQIIYTRYDEGQRIYNFTYDEQERISTMDFIFPNGNNHYHEYSYNDLGMVDTIMWRSGYPEGTMTKNYRYFQYTEGTKLVESVTQKSFDYEEGELTGESDISVRVRDIIYDANGKLLSFRTSSNVTNLTYLDPFNLGENVFAEYFQTNSYISSSRRQRRTEFDPVLSPLYTEAIPPFPITSDQALPVMTDLFWHKYIPIETIPNSSTWNDRDLFYPSYSYETDIEGNITKINFVYNGGQWYEKGYISSYTFVY
ncbi:hypothetical protein RBH94_02410 [Aestuariibaculum sp. YM273]|uniref:hypothetical protein n=1 Tax=Aestuariibaculum sp. YM273 TaxID=3070659 RepID=UPI0027DE1110|nr:hypothetical protein [Aestuariibaculum sp. YM273]WMI66021.1 hypothetical protein RBH94_02410 [Aestuariibaculum sp. YM273]